MAANAPPNPTLAPLLLQDIRGTQIPPPVALAQIGQESTWNPNALSGGGAEGIAQFEPGTFAEYGQGSPYNPADAFKAYTNYMGALLRQYRDNIAQALSAYNAGHAGTAAGNQYAQQILAAAPGQQAAAQRFGAGPAQAQAPAAELAAALTASPINPNAQFERVDQGVDYNQNTPYLAPGPGVIYGTSGFGGGSDQAVYERLNTPVTVNGHTYRNIYEAETAPLVHVGEHVKAGQPLQGPGAAEIGFAGAGTGPLAPLIGGLGAGTQPTQAGQDFRAYIQNLRNRPTAPLASAGPQVPQRVAGAGATGRASVYNPVVEGLIHGLTGNQPALATAPGLNRLKSAHPGPSPLIALAEQLLA